MTVSSFKCGFAVTTKCLLSLPTFKGLLGPSIVDLHVRTIGSCTNTFRIIPVNFIPTRPYSFKPVIRPTYCHCKQPYLPHTCTIKLSPCYSTEKQEPEKKLSLLQRFKEMYRDYWYVLVPVHAVTSLAWFGGFYYLLKSGVDVVGILESFEISDKILNPLRDSSAGYLAVSYAMYKIFTPLRYTVTLGGTTISINYLKKWGYIRPIPPREKLREMYEERRDNLKERRASIMETVRGTKEELRERKHNIVDSVKEKAKDLKPPTALVKKAVKKVETQPK